jgi:phage tail tape-measure protein
MSNSNPQLKQYIREQLMAKFLHEAKRQGVSTSNQQKTVPNATGLDATIASAYRYNARKSMSSAPTTTAISSAMQSAAGTVPVVAAVAPVVAGIKSSTSAAAKVVEPVLDDAVVAAGSKLKVGFENYANRIRKIDSALLGTAAKGKVAATKGIIGMGGKVGMATKLGGAGIGAVMQGIDSASTEWAENQDKGMSTGENIKNTAIRGGAGAVGAGLGTWGGVAAGAAIGSVVPVVGTAIGAVLGGIAGSMAGGYVGDKVGDAFTNIGDNPEAIKDFQASREIKDIQRKDKVQAERQRLADEKFTKGKPAAGDGKSSDTPAGVDYNSTDDSDDRDQEQDFSYNSRPNQGNDVTAAGGQVNVRMRQSQRQ